MKAIIISGYLYNLSDNINSLINRDTDVYVHTWDIADNIRWVQKLKRYKKFCNKLVITLEKPIFDKKLYSYFYSTWKAVNLIKNIEQYSSLIKFKPNLDTDKVIYTGNLEQYFNKAFIQSRPLLNSTVKQECFYGQIYYQTMDERMFSGYPLAFKKVFHTLYKDFYKEMISLDESLIKLYGEDYEGSIFWKEYIERKGVKLIQDLDLKLTNNK